MGSSGSGRHNPKCTFQKGPILPTFAEDIQGHSTPAMLRRYAATYNSEQAAQAHAGWSPMDRLSGSGGK